MTKGQSDMKMAAYATAMGLPRGCAKVTGNWFKDTCPAKRPNGLVCGASKSQDCPQRKAP